MPSPWLNRWHRETLRKPWEPMVYVGRDGAPPDRVTPFVYGALVGAGLTAALVLVVLAWPVAR